MKKPDIKNFEKIDIFYTPTGGKIVRNKVDWKAYALALEKYKK